MKKILSSLTVLVTTIFIAQADIIYPDGTKPMPEPYALKKLSRGIANLLTFPLEIPKAAYDAGNNYGITDIRQFSDALTVGPYKALRRAGAGVYDFATFLDEEKLPKYRIDPEFLSPADLIPGYTTQFDWDSVDGPGSRQQ
jgi:putative exosortase-associated protein (TIGR04073 family)